MTFQKVTKMTEITVPLHTTISSTVCTLNMSIKSSRAPSSQLLNGFKGNKKNVQDWSVQHWTRNPRIQVRVWH